MKWQTYLLRPLWNVESGSGLQPLQQVNHRWREIYLSLFTFRKVCQIRYSGICFTVFWARCLAVPHVPRAASCVPPRNISRSAVDRVPLDNEWTAALAVFPILLLLSAGRSRTELVYYIQIEVIFAQNSWYLIYTEPLVFLGNTIFLLMLILLCSPLWPPNPFFLLLPPEQLTQRLLTSLWWIGTLWSENPGPSTRAVLVGRSRGPYNLFSPKCTGTS